MIISQNQPINQGLQQIWQPTAKDTAECDGKLSVILSRVKNSCFLSSFFIVILTVSASTGKH